MIDLIRVISKFRQLKVAVVGDLITDVYRHGKVSRISPEGPHPVFAIDGRVDVNVGGAGNVWRNMTAMGADAWLFAPQRFGGDLVGNVVIDPGNKPIVKERLVAGGGHVIARVDDDGGISWDAPYLDKLLDGKYDAIVISDYGKGAISDYTARAILNPDRQITGLTFVDPCKGASAGKYVGASFIKPNIHELRTMFPELDPMAAAVSLASMVGGVCVLTQESGPVVCASRDGVLAEVLPAKVQVADVTGAGDTFMAAFALSLTAGATVKDGAEIATAAAEIAVTMRGAAVIDAIDLVTRVAVKHYGRILPFEVLSAMVELFGDAIVLSGREHSKRAIAVAMVSGSADAVRKAMDVGREFDFICLGE